MTNWIGRMELAYAAPFTLSNAELQRLEAMFAQIWPQQSADTWRYINVPKCDPKDLAGRLNKNFAKSFKGLCKHPEIQAAQSILHPFGQSTWRRVGPLHVGEMPVPYTDSNGVSQELKIDFGGTAKADVFVRIEFNKATEFAK